jgi:hypothetical protein
MTSRGTALLFAAAFALVGATRSAAQASSTPPVATTTPPSASQVFKLVSPSVFVVEALDWKSEVTAFGGGVSVAKSLVVTNCHVVQGSWAVRVKQGEREWVAIDMGDYYDSERDLCMLHVRGLNAPTVSIRASSSLQVGETAYAIGAPEGLELSVSEGIISALRGCGECEDAKLIQTTAAVSPGSSGGGLFDSSARLIGITSFRIEEGQNLNFALPGEWVRAVTNKDSAIAIIDDEAVPDLDAGDVSSAVEKVREAADRDHAAYAYFDLAAQWLANAGDIEGAIEECREWLRAESESPLDSGTASESAAAHDCLGKMLGKKHDDGAARAEFREAIRLDPQAAPQHTAFADFLKSEGDASQASLEEAQADYCLGRSSETLGDLEGALAKYKEAHELDPLGPNIRYALDALAQKLKRNSPN